MNPNKEEILQPDDEAKERLERAIEKRKTQKYIFRLYVTGATGKSMRAIENFRKLADEHLKDRYELEIIDIYEHPEQARSEQVIAAPTMIKKLPLPLRRYIGDLSDSERVLVGLEIKEKDNKP